MNRFFWAVICLPHVLGALFFSSQEAIPTLVARYQREHQQEHDMQSLQQLGLHILKVGVGSRDAENALLSLFGCGAALHEEATKLLVRAADSSDPNQQLVALSLLAQQLDSHAEKAATMAMGSYHLLIRLEALHLLCQMRLAVAYDQIDALQAKVDPQLEPLFVQLFALLGSERSIDRMRQMMCSARMEVRVETILQAAAKGLDQLLPEIQNLAKQLSALQREAAAWALGQLGVSESKQILEQIAVCGVENTEVAALQALSAFGEKEADQRLAQKAKKGNIFAIVALTPVDQVDQVLRQIVEKGMDQAGVNAAIALGCRGDREAIEKLLPFFTTDGRDLALLPVRSVTGALSAWKAIPSATVNMQDPIQVTLSQKCEESLLFRLSQTLPEKDFLPLAEAILQKGKGHLIPLVITSLQTLQTECSVALLRKYQHKLGDPLTRHFCELALFRLQEPGLHKDRLVKWLLKQVKEEMITMRPAVPWEKHRSETAHVMCPSERSQLMIETFQTLAAEQDKEGIDLLLTAIRDGHPNNAFALAGLLIRAAS